MVPALIVWWQRGDKLVLAGPSLAWVDFGEMCWQSCVPDGVVGLAAGVY